MAKLDWIEIEKGVYTLREKSSRPMIKINSNDLPKEEFNPSKRTNTDEPFYCDYWKGKVTRGSCFRCPNYLRKTCLLVDKEHVMRI